jgi:hypothetical protein
LPFAKQVDETAVGLSVVLADQVLDFTKLDPLRVAGIRLPFDWRSLADATREWNFPPRPRTLGRVANIG